MRLAFTSPATTAVIDAARAWRIARDLGQPVQPVLSTRLGVQGGGFLAPVLDGLLALFEAAFCRRFDAGGLSDNVLTGDEQRLLELLDRVDAGASIGIRPDLSVALRTALRSTRIMLRSVLALPAGDGLESAATALRDSLIWDTPAVLRCGLPGRTTSSDTKAAR